MSLSQRSNWAECWSGLRLFQYSRDCPNLRSWLDWLELWETVNASPVYLG